MSEFKLTRREALKAQAAAVAVSVAFGPPASATNLVTEKELTELKW
jgi:hypothetical protein